MVREVFADVFLGLATVVVLASAAGVLVMANVYQKVHFVTPASLVAPVLVAVAVWIKAGLTATTGETLLVLLFVVASAPVLSHATIRAARNRERGDWRAGRAGGPTQSETER